MRPLERGCLLELGDDGGPGTVRPLPLEGRGKTTRSVGQGLALERGEVGCGFALRNDESGVRKDGLKMGGERPAPIARGRGGHEAILEEMEGPHASQQPRRRGTEDRWECLRIFLGRTQPVVKTGSERTRWCRRGDSNPHTLASTWT